MNRTLLIRLGLIAAALLLLKLGWNRVSGDEGMMLVYFIGVGVVAGLLVVKYVLPRFGDAVGTAVFLPGEPLRADEDAKAAAAKLAQGDFEGAIAEHEKALAANPDQSFPVAEIAKICADRLHDPQRALGVLRQHLEGRAWPEDDAAFLRFRMADVCQSSLHDFAATRRHLERVITDFPNTRHSANARHRLGELEQAEYKQLAAQRAKGAAGQAS